MTALVQLNLWETPTEIEITTKYYFTIEGSQEKHPTDSICKAMVKIKTSKPNSRGSGYLFNKEGELVYLVDEGAGIFFCEFIFEVSATLGFAGMWYVDAHGKFDDYESGITKAHGIKDAAINQTFDSLKWHFHNFKFKYFEDGVLVEEQSYQTDSKRFFSDLEAPHA